MVFFSGKINFFKELLLNNNYGFFKVNSAINFKKAFFILGSSLVIRRDVKDFMKSILKFNKVFHHFQWHSLGVLADCLGRISAYETAFLL